MVLHYYIVYTVSTRKLYLIRCACNSKLNMLRYINSILTINLNIVFNNIKQLIAVYRYQVPGMRSLLKFCHYTFIIGYLWIGMERFLKFVYNNIPHCYYRYT